MEPEHWLEIREPENYLSSHEINIANLEVTVKLSCLQFRGVNACYSLGVEDPVGSSGPKRDNDT